MITAKYPLSKMFWRKAKPEYQKEERLYFNEGYLEEGFEIFKKIRVEPTLAQELAWLAHMVQRNDKNPRDTFKSAQWLQDSFKTVKLDVGERTALREAVAIVESMSATDLKVPSAGPVRDVFFYRLTLEGKAFDNYVELMREEFQKVDQVSWVTQEKKYYKSLLAMPEIMSSPMAKNYWETRIRQNLTDAVFAHPAQQESLFSIKP